MRIVSLLPAATEWVCAVGARDLLVGRSHECDFPADIDNVPVVTAATYPDLADSAAIDAQVRSHVQKGLSLYHVDVEQLRALQPDLIITQDQCVVCAISRDDLAEALTTWIGKTPEVLSMHPRSVKHVMEWGLKIGRAVGKSREAMRFIAAAEQRLQQLQTAIGTVKRAAPGRSVVCIEWLEPLMTAGHWMPGLVELAGGRALLAEAGARSEYITWEAIQAADPDVLALIPCGFDLSQTQRDVHYLTSRPGWSALRAVQSGQVYMFDGNAYFNRPGPRLYRSIELMAHALHPEKRQGFVAPIAEWEIRSWKQLGLHVA